MIIPDKHLNDSLISGLIKKMNETRNETKNEPVKEASEYFIKMLVSGIIKMKNNCAESMEFEKAALYRDYEVWMYDYFKDDTEMMALIKTF